MADPGLRVILLDCLGTLLQLEPPAPRLRAALARRGHGVTEEEAARAVRAEIAYYVEHHLEGRDPRSLAALRTRCALVVARTLGLGDEHFEVAAAALSEALRFQPYGDVAPALGALRGAGLRLVVVSNWDCSLPATLAATGLAKLVDGVVTSAGVGAAKPDPRPVAAALELVGCSPRQALLVGDSPETDVRGARALGVSPLLLVRDEQARAPRRAAGSGRGEAAPTVRSLGELLSLVLR